MKNQYFLAMVFALVTTSLMAKPLANFECTTPIKKAFSNVTFKNTSVKAKTFVWNFGDGNTSTDVNPTHRYTTSGDFVVKLQAINGKKISEKEMTINVGTPDHCMVEIETSYGTMTAVLYDETPQHRDNFLKLAGEGFYDGLLFHRVISGFMIQGGDPTSRGAKPNAPLGSGGPEYKIPAEFVASKAHTKGALAAARQGDGVNPEKKSSGSQFYIVQGRPQTRDALKRSEDAKGINYPKEVIDKYVNLGGTPFLDQDYTVFGEVIKGLDIIDAIAAAATLPGDRPKEDIWMKIRVISK